MYIFYISLSGNFEHVHTNKLCTPHYSHLSNLHTLGVLIFAGTNFREFRNCFLLSSLSYSSSSSCLQLQWYFLPILHIYNLVNILKVFYTGTSAAIKGSKMFFKTFTGCRQEGVKSPVLFNIYLDFVLQYSYRIPGHCSTREQRSVNGLSGNQRLRMILCMRYCPLVWWHRWAFGNFKHLR